MAETIDRLTDAASGNAEMTMRLNHLEAEVARLQTEARKWRAEYQWRYDVIVQQGERIARLSRPCAHGPAWDDPHCPWCAHARAFEEALMARVTDLHAAGLDVQAVCDAYGAAMQMCRRQEAS